VAATREATVDKAASKAAGTSYATLSPGPGTPASQVAAHQCARFHSAMIELVAERGYSKVAVRDLAGVAKVSTRAFYKNFSGKEDCFLRTHELVVRRAAKRVIAAQAGERDWQERLRLAFRAFVRELEREPQASHLALVEAYVDGPVARVQARRAERVFESMLADSFRRAPDGLPVSPLLVEGIVAGVVEVARRRLLSGPGEFSPGLADGLLEWALRCREHAALSSPQAPLTLSSSKVEGGSRSNMADRDLILAAVGKLVIAEGYERLTVPGICAAAGVSRRSFEAQFSGVEECFLTAVELQAEGAVKRAALARRTAKAEEEEVRRAIAALCDEIASDPVLARLCFAEVLFTGQAGAQCSLRIVDRIASLLSPPGASAAGPPFDLATEATAGMIWGVVNHRLLAEHSGCHPTELTALVSIVADR
jgi:AcrR family transcriptional regulator